MAERKWSWVAVGTLVTLALGLIPGYFILWKQPNLIYEVTTIDIPIPSDLRQEVCPNKLLRVVVRNIGRKPSQSVRGHISVPGKILYREIAGPGPAYGDVKTMDSTDESLQFVSSSLSQGQHPIRFSIWYDSPWAGSARSAEEVFIKLPPPLDVGVSDSEGPAKKVSSIEAETRRWRGLLLGMLTGLLAGFALWNTIYMARRTRRSLNRLLEQHEKLKDDLEYPS